MWHTDVIAELEAADDPRSTTNKASPSLSLSALFPTGLRCSGAGILMNTWQRRSVDRQAPGCGAGVVLLVGDGGEAG